MIDNNPTTISKPNDWLVVNAVNKNATLDDLKVLDVVPNNTELKDETFYKQQPGIQELFKSPKGDFDDLAFNKYYDSLVKSYNVFSTQAYDVKNFTQNLLYNDHDFLAPVNAKIKPYSVGITKIFNPNSSRIGTEGFGVWSDSPFSLREIAQTQDVKNQLGKSLGFTPNDDNKSGWYDFMKDKFFGSKDTLALALWTEEGTHIDPFTESSVKHKKGEYKYNEFGKPFYETLEGKNTASRDILSPWDTMTVDGSNLDRYNFMSGDDKHKSFVGSIMRSAARIMPYAIPGIGQWYALGTAAITAAEFAPQLGKMVGGFIQGDDFKATDLYKDLNSIEGFSKSIMGHSVSDYSTSKMWTWENMLTMIPDIFIQLKQQRAIGEIPKMLKLTSADAKLLNMIANTKGEALVKEVKDAWAKAKTMKSPMDEAMTKRLSLMKNGDADLLTLYDGWINTQNRIAKGLSIGYMTAASSGDVEQIVDQFDIGARDASWMKLGVLAAFWLEMNYWSLGDWLVDYAVGLDDATKFLKKSIKAKGGELSLGLEALSNKVAPKAAAELALTPSFIQSLKGISGMEMFRKGQELGKSIALKIDGSSILTAMIKEGIEEMSEETFTDGAKAVYNIFFDLNLTSNKDQRINWDNDQTFSRYALAGIGGALGGALFHGNDAMSKPMRDGMMSEDFANMAIDLFRNGQGNDVYKALDEIKNSSKGFASKDLTFDIFKTELTQEGTQRVFKPVDKLHLSQNDVIANLIRTQLQLIEKGIFSAKVPSNKQLQTIANTTGIFLDLNEHTAISDDLNKLSLEFVELYDQLQVLNANEKPTSIDEKRMSDLSLEIQTKQKAIEAMSSPEVLSKYLKEALFNLDTDLNESYIVNTDEESISQALYDTNYAQLNDVQKEIVDKQTASQVSKREKLRIAQALFDKQATLVKNTIGPVNLFMEQRQKIQSKIDQVEFDFHRQKWDPETEINQVLPAYSKKGILEFFKASKNVDRALITDPEKYTLLNNFYEFVNGLLDVYSSNPEVVTDEEFLLLKYILENLGKNKVNIYDHLSDSTIVEYFKSKADFEELADAEEFKKHLKNLKELEGTTISILANQLLNPLLVDDYSTSEFGYTPGNDPFKLTYEFLLSKNDLRLLEIQKQIALFDRLQKLNLQKSSSFSLLDEFLKSLHIQFKTDKNSIFDLIEQERTHLLEKPLEEYIQQSDITLEEIKRLKESLRRIRTVIKAYINFSPDINTAIGYFPAVNEYNKKNGLPDLYEQMSAASAVPLKKYIRHMEDRLTYLEALSVKNINSKIPNKEKSEVVMNVLAFRNFWKKLSQIDAFDDLMKKAEGVEEFKNLFSTTFESEKALSEFLGDLRNDQISNILKFIWETEHRVFERTQEIQSDPTESSKFKGQFLSAFVSKDVVERIENILIEEEFTNYSKQSTKITELDQLFYLVNAFTSDSYVFLKDYHELMNEPIKFAMFGDQQNLFKATHAFLQSNFADNFGLKLNLKASDLLTLIHSQLKDLSLGFKANEDLFVDNIFSIYGLLGTGKTVAVLDFISKVLKKHNLNSIAVAKEKNISEKLLTEISENMITNVDTQNLHTLLEEIFGKQNYLDLLLALEKDASDDNVHSILKFGTTTGKYPSINTKHEIITRIINNMDKQSSFNLKLNNDAINVILIDEFTQVHTVISQLLNRFVNTYNSKTRDNKLLIITTGDWRQPGATSSLDIDSSTGPKRELFNANLQQLCNIRSIDLNSSIRVENNSKDFNSKNLLTLVELNANNDKVIGEPELTLKYHETTDKFFGDKSVDYTQPGQSQAELLQKLIMLAGNGNDPSKVAIISNKENTAMKLLLAEFKVTFLEIEKMNGVEFDYVLVDADFSKLKPAFNIYLKYLNGALTRSKKGTYINQSAFEIHQNFKVNNIFEKLIYDISLPKEKIETYKLKRIKLINGILLDLSQLTLPTSQEPYKPSTKVTDPKNTAKFNMSATGQTTVLTTDDIVDELNKTNDKGDKEAYHTPSILIGHTFGKDTDEIDPSGRAILPNRKIKIQNLTSFAKSLYIENSYKDVPKTPKELRAELLLFVNKEMKNDVEDIDLVIYERDWDDKFDEAVSKKIYNKKEKKWEFDSDAYKAKTIMTYAVRLKSNGEYLYLPLGALTTEMQELVYKNFQGDGDTFANEINGIGEDIPLDRDRLIEFLSPNLSLRIDNDIKIPVEDLSKDFVVSNVYIVANEKLNDHVQYGNGNEFVLISADHSLQPESLFSVFRTELQQAASNRLKKALDGSKKNLAVSNSRVKMVVLDRTDVNGNGLDFKTWILLVDKARRDHTNRKSTLRSLGDSYISLNLFNILLKRYSTLLSKLEKLNETLEKYDEIKSLTTSEKAFTQYFANVLNVLRLNNSMEKSTILTKLKGDMKDSRKMLRELETSIAKMEAEKERDPLFQTSHFFTYLLHTALNGGVLYEANQSIKIVPMSNDSSTVIDYIDDIIKSDDGKKIFKHGIFYTAQFAKGNTDTDYVDWLYELNIHPEDLKYFSVSKVSMLDIDLPVESSIFNNSVEEEVVVTPPPNDTNTLVEILALLKEKNAITNRVVQLLNQHTFDLTDESREDLEKIAQINYTVRPTDGILNDYIFNFNLANIRTTDHRMLNLIGESFDELEFSIFIVPENLDVIVKKIKESLKDIPDVDPIWEDTLMDWLKEKDESIKEDHWGVLSSQAFNEEWNNWDLIEDLKKCKPGSTPKSKFKK